jgi:hypothetical protein
MSKTHTVKPSDCIASIAFENGFAPDTLERHPSNRELRDRRENLNMLMPGEDRVFIPEMTPKEESGETDTRHTFRRRGVPEVLRLRVLDEKNDPVARAPYRLDIDGQLQHGSTDEDGRVEVPIPPNARRGKLIVKTETTELGYELMLGNLAPITEITGIKGRLRNLGYEISDDDGVRDSPIPAARRPGCDRPRRRRDPESTSAVLRRVVTGMA